MKTKTYYRVLFLFLLPLFLGSCATLDKAALRQFQPAPLEDIVLQPSYDLFDIRLDIIRQKTIVSDSTHNEENQSYRTLGFYLGNGLFFDVNRNISLLVPELLGVSTSDSFSIDEFDRRGRLRYEYQRQPDAYNVKVHSLISWTQKSRLEFTDSTLAVRRGLFGRYTLAWTDSTLQHRGFLESNTIVPIEGGYMIPKLLLKRKYLQQGQTITLDNRYQVSLEGNSIRISKKNLFGNWRSLYTIIRSEDTMYIYDRHKRGKKLTFLDHELQVMENKRLYRSYLLR